MGKKKESNAKNKQNKLAKRQEGEKRVGREQIAELLEMSHSADPAERKEAASYLCLCHVRRRIDEVWDALFRMMEDQDEGVRAAAWHTLEDGGRTDDPRLDQIIEHRLEVETNKAVLQFARMFAGNKKEREDIEIRAAGRSEYILTGKCDFCGESSAKVRRDLDTVIPDGGSTRAALVCEQCDKVAV